ncbi:mitochondrial import inner membrane translocase subunit TIM44-like [Artemia franciscana]|uniref:Mitochondrial import inner membrane translocase subunit TIM44 n=1 Tax=Artemia franciscana TaxID=6661 RepID=A0AA88KTJ2_ARTSF|nr:hypothetical protein QYM36_016250 [Artemia franciscana]
MAYFSKVYSRTSPPINSLVKNVSIRTEPSTIKLAQSSQILLQQQDVRFYSDKRPSFISSFVENLKQEMARNKEMKDNLKKFREEAAKLEQSDALKKARQKFQDIEAEAEKSGEFLKGGASVFKEKLQDVIEEAGKSEIGRKAGEITEEISKTARGAASSIAETGKKLGETSTFQTLSKTAQAVKKEIDEGALATGSRVYRPPLRLRKRKEELDSETAKVIQVNTEATGIELHKDSKFYQSWVNFKENNQYINKVLELKTKYDESDSPVVRAARVLTEKVGDIVGGIFSKTELSEALTEIVKMDPDFNKEKFLKECEYDIIPNVLEAMVRGDLEILKDWCHEAPFNVISTPIKQAQSMGYKMDCRIIDIDHVDLAMGKIMEQGPILVITFQSQQILCVRDAANNVVEGDASKIMRVNYVWVLCRDQTELDPKSAWRLMDLSANSSEQFI